MKKNMQTKSLRAYAKQSTAVYAPIRRAARSPQSRQSRRAFAMTQKTHAFTLIELSIVLVIIGLIVGGVLVGRDLIQAASLRAQLSVVEKLNTAVITFKLKYNCLPGDCAGAANFFGAVSQPEQVTNGNGDKFINGTAGAGSLCCVWRADTSNETMSVFDHLAAAGLTNLPQYDETDDSIMGVPGRSFPESVFYSQNELDDPAGWPGPADDNGQLDGAHGMVIGYQPYDRALPHLKPAHYTRLGMRRLESGGYVHLSSKKTIQPWDAQSIDDKIDDGKPYSGGVMIHGLTGTYVTAFGHSLACADLIATDASAQSAEYRSINNLISSWGKQVEKTCEVMIRAGF